jgi:hypothetical protein
VRVKFVNVNTSVMREATPKESVARSKSIMRTTHRGVLLCATRFICLNIVYGDLAFKGNSL